MTDYLAYMRALYPAGVSWHFWRVDLRKEQLQINIK